MLKRTPLLGENGLQGQVTGSRQSYLIQDEHEMALVTQARVSNHLSACNAQADRSIDELKASLASSILLALRGEFYLASVPCEPKLDITTHSKRQGIIMT